MPNDLQYAAPTDANGNPFVGGVDTATGHMHPLEVTTTDAITGSPTSATAGRLVTVTKDGDNAAIGATTDAAVTSDASGTLSSKLRGLVKILADVWDSVNHRVKVDGSGVTQPVSGTVGVSSLPALPAGSNAIGSVSVSNFPATQPISAAALPLPSGAATAAKQPALGTAGSASADVISIQGIASMTAVKVDGSAVTQPVSGTVTANAGTNMSTAALALETGGNLATLAGIVSSSKAAVKAASGDFADGAINTVGTQADAAYTSGSGTLVALLKGLFTRTPALGQAAMASSTPIVIASDQSNVPGNIKQINGSTLALGQTTMSASLPVAIASDQGHLTVDQGTSAAAGTRWRTGGDFVEIAGAGTGTVNAQNTDFIPSTDVSAYKWLSLHITGSFSLTLTFQGSNDNSNWLSVPLINTASYTGSNANTSTSSTNQIWAGPVTFRYFRVRATTYASNTSLAGNLELYTQAPAMWISTLPTPAATTVNGTTDFHLISANTTNANNVKASAGNLYGYDIGNNGASDAWVKLYNTAGTPTAGSGTPLRVIYIPKGSAARFHSTTGIAFGTGIGLTITGGAADNDTTAVATSQVTVELDYK